MAIRGVFIVTLLPPITTFGIKSAKYRCSCVFFGRKQWRYLAKTLLFRFDIRLFLSFLCNFTGEKGRKIRSDAVKNASRCSICYVPTQQKLRPDVVKDTSGRNFRSVLVAIKERLFLTSSEPLVSFKWASLELYVDYSPSRKKCPKNVPHFGYSAPPGTGNESPLLVLLMPVTCSLSAHLMVTDRPLNGLWQNILCTFIPNHNQTCQSFLSYSLFVLSFITYWKCRR